MIQRIQRIENQLDAARQKRLLRFLLRLIGCATVLDDLHGTAKDAREILETVRAKLDA